MRKNLRFLIAVFPAGLLVMALCGAGLHKNAEELLTLKAQGDEEAAKEKETVAHDQVFQNVRQALAAGQIKKGIKASEVQRKYGDPLATATGPEGVKWLYKARGNKKWLEVPRVWLYFDKNKVLTDWECAYTSCS